MKKIIILLVFLISFSKIGFTQQINGEILSDTANITILKIWGTHEERGFAYGYFLGEQITNVVEGYILPLFGPYLDDARNINIELKKVISNNAGYFIYDLDGKQIKGGYLYGFFTNAISINDLSKGMYILKLVNGKNFYVRKFVKK